MSMRGARYIHVMVPCPLGWGTASSETLSVARLATQSGLFPVFEAEYGEVVASSPIRRQVPVEDYLKVQNRFAPLFAPTKRQDKVENAQETGDNALDLKTPPTPEARPKEVKAAAVPEPSPDTKKKSADEEAEKTKAAEAKAEKAAAEKAAAEKAVQDSINTAMQKITADSLAAVAAAEQARMDSLNTAMMKAQQDSIDAANKKAAKKPKPKAKPKAEVKAAEGAPKVGMKKPGSK